MNTEGAKVYARGFLTQARGLWFNRGWTNRKA